MDSLNWAANTRRVEGNIVHTLNEHDGQPAVSYLIALTFANSIWESDTTRTNNGDLIRFPNP